MIRIRMITKSMTHLCPWVSYLPLGVSKVGSIYKMRTVCEHDD